MATVFHSLRQALRTLRRQPGFSCAVIGVVALGIGINALVFSVVHAVLVRSVPYPEGDRLVLITGHMATDPSKEMPLSYLDIRDLTEQAQSLDGMAARTLGRSLNIVADGAAENVTGEFIGHDYFAILGVEPAAGRFFAAEHEDPGEQRFAIIGHDLWNRRYGGRDAAVGGTIDLDGRSYQIIGVAPPGFRGLSDSAEVWLPIPMAAAVYGQFYVDARAFRWLAAIGRLAPGATLQSASEEITALTDGLAEQYPGTNVDYRAHVESLADTYFGDIRANLLLLWGAAGLVLLIACANVAALMLIRLISRRSELSVRAALGAGYRRLVVDIFAESAVLAAAGTVVGVLLAVVAGGVGRTMLLQGLPSFVDARVDFVVVAAMAAAMALVCGVVSTVPAWLLGRMPLQPGNMSAARSSGGGLARWNSQSVLVVTEVALAMALCSGAALTFKGFEALMQRDLGLRTSGVLTARMDVQDERFDEGAAYVGLVEQLEAVLNDIPGVDEAALVGPKMPTDDWNSITVTIEDRSVAGLDPMGIDMVVHRISPRFFRVAGVPLVRGRAFEPTDRGGIGAPPVAVVSRTTAERMWPDEDPLGKRLKFGGPGSNAAWLTVVGIAADATFAGLGPPPPLDMDLYLPLLQFPARTPPLLNVMIRADLPNDAILPQVRDRVAELAPQSPLFDVRTLQDRIREQVAPRRAVVNLMGIFAALAVGLAAVGIYAVLSYAVAEQRRELGIRLALGANAAGLFGMVVGRALRVAALGIAAGLVASLSVVRLTTRWLEGVSPLDPASYAGAAVAVVVLTLAATLLPAARAARTDPATSVKEP